jgi:hypothetical protein
MPPFSLSQLQSTPTPEPEAQAPAHDKGASTVEEPTETPSERLLKGWGTILQSLEVCAMAVPDLLEDQEAWMREWVSVKVSVLDPFGAHMRGRVLLYLCIIVRTI